ncbi:MAG: hypothetical protein D6803_04415, partial [Anaerolineae bacterium]
MYRRAWDRLWRPALLLGLMCGLLWWQSGVATTPLLANANTPWMLAAAIVSLGIGLFGLLARRMGYVRLYPAYLQLVTPFLKLRISYRRVRSARPVAIAELFPPSQQPWGRRKFLAPFYGMTAVAVELRGFPLPPWILRFFLPRQLFLPQTTGLVFLVPDWMRFSTELDAFLGRWRDRV